MRKGDQGDGVFMSLDRLQASSSYLLSAGRPEFSVLNLRP
jgi:hypothetical protein